MWVRMMTQLEIIVRNIAISTRGDQCRSPGLIHETDDLTIVFKHDAHGVNAQLG